MSPLYQAEILGRNTPITNPDLKATDGRFDHYTLGFADVKAPADHEPKKFGHRRAIRVARRLAKELDREVLVLGVSSLGHRIVIARFGA